MTQAQTYSDVQSALNSGRYTQAAQLGEALATPEALAVAAESLNAQILLCRIEDPKKSARQARKLAERALKIDPVHPNALLQYALAEALVTRRSSPITVWRKKLPQKLLENIQAYKNVRPNDPRIEAFIGAWHFGIVRRAGPKRAKDWYGASVEDGITAYEYALKLHPDDMIIATNYAFSILEHNPEKYAPQAIEILNHVTNSKTDNVLERDLQKLIRDMLDLMKDDIIKIDVAVENAGFFLDGGS